MAALASLEDLAAVGSINVDWEPGSTKHVRALRLLEMASAAVVVYLSRFGITRAGIEEWDDDRRTALSSIVAEVASRRLQLAAASNVDVYNQGPDNGPSSIKLTTWDERNLRRLVVPSIAASGLSTISITREGEGMTDWISCDRRSPYESILGDVED